MKIIVDKLMLEEEDLNGKIERLKDVLINEFYPSHKIFMTIQLNAMKNYLIALRERIEIEKQINK
jgi:hypothetical protein